jgi:hypothetical protein
MLAPQCAMGSGKPGETRGIGGFDDRKAALRHDRTSVENGRVGAFRRRKQAMDGGQTGNDRGIGGFSDGHRRVPAHRAGPWRPCRRLP